MDEDAIMNAEAEGLTSFAMLVGVDQNPVLGFFLLFLIVTVLNIIVFNLGFARKLPLLKNVIVYIALIIGSFMLTFFALGLPIAEGLTIAAIVLIIYKIRLRQTQRKEQSSE